MISNLRMYLGQKTGIYFGLVFRMSLGVPKLYQILLFRPVRGICVRT